MAVWVLAMTFFGQGFAFFNFWKPDSFGNGEYWAQALFISLLTSGFIVYCLRHYRIKQNGYLLLFSAGILITDFLAISYFPGIYDTGDLIFSPGLEDSLRAFTFFGLSLVCFYVFIVFLPQIIREESSLDIVFILIALAGLVAIFYSLITEHTLYLDLVKNGKYLNAYSVPMSFCGNRNVYSFMIFLALLATAHLHSERPRWWCHILILFFLANILLTLSKTTFLSAVIFMAGFYLYRYIVTLKKQPIRNNVALGIVVSSIGLLFLFAYLNRKSSNRIFAIGAGLLDFFKGSVSSSAMTRIYAISDVLRAMDGDPLTFLWGYSFYLFRMSLPYIIGEGISVDTYTLDCSYVTLLGELGVFGLIFYAAVLAFIFVKIAKGMKKNSPTAWASLFMVISILVNGITEDSFFVGISNRAVAVLTVAVLPVLVSDSTKDKAYLEDAWSLKWDRVQREPLPNRTSPFALTVRRALWVEVPLWASLFGLSYGIKEMQGSFAYASVWSLSSFALAFIFIPLLIGSIHYLLYQKRMAATICLSFFTISWILFTLELPFISPTYGVIGGMLFGLILFLVVLFDGQMPFAYDIVVLYWRELLSFGLCLGVNLLMVFTNGMTPTFLVTLVTLNLTINALALVTWGSHDLKRDFQVRWDNAIEAPLSHLAFKAQLWEERHEFSRQQKKVAP